MRTLSTGWILLLLMACPKRTASGEDPLVEALRRADEAWANRADTGLEEAEDVLDLAYGLAPNAPEVLWRLVRHRHAVGLTEETPRAAVYAFAEARALGMTCLDGDPTFATARRSRGWEAAIEKNRPERSACLAWTSLVWSRWIATHGGEAAAIDLPAAFALAEGASALDDRDLATLGQWSTGLLELTAPGWAGGDAAAGLLSLEGVVSRRPKDLVPQTDRVLFGAPHLDGAAMAPLLQGIRSATPRTPEEQATVAKVTAAHPG